MDNKQINKKHENEKKIVSLMIRLYCNGNHGSAFFLWAAE